MRVDLLTGEAQGEVSTGDELTVAPAVESELLLVTVVDVAVELHHDPSFDHEVHLADALNVHPVFEIQTCVLKVQAGQRLQRRTRGGARSIRSGERPSRPS